MKKLTLRITSLLLALMMLAGGAPLSGISQIDFDLPFSVRASALTSSGNCGPNLTYNLNTTTGILTISGTGDMFDYSADNDPPWLSSGSGSITGVVINSGVTSVGAYAFKAFFVLTSVQIPATVKKINARAFDNCIALTTVTVEDGATIQTKSKLETIGERAFSQCISLVNITLPSAVLSIGYQCFMGCSALTGITLPDSMTTIGERAFYNCSALTTLTIPKGVTSLGYLALRNCTSLSSINVSSENTKYSSLDGVLFNKAKDVLMTYPMNKQDIEFYDVPDSVITISSSAFEGNDYIEHIYVPKYVHTIGDQAFHHCDSLIFVEIDPSSPFFVSNETTGALTRRDRNTLVLVPAGVSANQFVVPDEITEIANYAFYGCDNIKNVRIGKNVTSIRNFALGFYEFENNNAKYDDFTIYCYMGSAAQDYAIENGINYELIDKPWDGTAANLFLSGEGTQASPYNISTAQQLSLMAGLINGTITTYDGQPANAGAFAGAYYNLCGDINLNNTANWENWLTVSNLTATVNAPARTWTPISEFSGVFDGCGYSINGLFVNGNSAQAQGLFANLNGGQIKNLGLTNSVVYSNISAAGLVVGSITSGTVSNCYAGGEVFSTFVAGTIAGLNAGGTIEKSYAYATVTTQSSGGGIAGTNQGTVANCFSASTVTVNQNGGGIAGANSGFINNCYNIGAVSTVNADPATSYIGGIAGSCSVPLTNVSGCYYCIGSAQGGINGTDAQLTSTAPLSQDALTNQASFPGWDFTSIWTVLKTSGSYPYPSIRSNPYKLKSLPVFYAVTVVERQNGVVTPGSSVVPINSVISFTVTPNEGYSINEIYVDNVLLGNSYPESTEQKVTLTRVTKEHSILATFKPNLYNAVFDPGDGAFVGVTGSITVPTEFGTIPTQPGTPVLDGMDFDGWDSQLAPIGVGGAIYTARYVSQHIHDYSIFDHTTQATCLVDGETVYRCNCGEKSVTVLPAVGYHQWNSTPTIDVPATCTTAGSQSIRCSVCGEMQAGTSQVIAPLGHLGLETNWVVDKAATCSLAGIKHIACQRPGCDYIERENTVIEPLGHSYDDDHRTVIKQPTCTEDGQAIYQCVRSCSTTEIRTLPKLGHIWGDWQTTLPATCTAEGSEHRICSRAGCEEVRALAMVDHTYGAWTVTVVPTCGSTGTRQRVCSVCNRIDTETLPVSHTFATEFTVDTQPTCFNEGSKSKHCTICGERSEITAIPQLTHQYGAWQIVRAQTASQNGLRKQTCSLCGNDKIELIGSIEPSFSVSPISAITYTGKPICPSVSVKAGNTTLTAGTDYYVEYFNNINVGTASAVVTGMGSYTGSVILSFAINKADISLVTVVPIPSCPANGLPCRPVIYATIDGSYVAQDKDFTCTYSNNVSAGTATVVLTGIGNYSKTKTATFTVAANTAPFTVDPIAPLDYIASPRTPAAVVKSVATGTLLTIGVDYNVAYQNNRNAGYATVVVTGIGAYAGTVTVGFVIKPKNISSVTSPTIADQAFNFTAQTPSFRLVDGSGELAYNTDYVSTFSNNIAVGTATAQVSGKGNYYGTATYFFNITKAQASSFIVTVSGPAYYTGSALTPAISVTYGGTTLRSGVHYTAVYSNNINLGTNTAVITITGMGNFVGQKVVNFSIIERPATRVTGITLDKTSATVSYDSTVVIAATVSPGDATNKKINWTLSGSVVSMTVSTDGTKCTLKGTGSGSATVKATTEDGSYSATCAVTAKMSFWQKIVAFFRSLFGGSNSVAYWLTR